MLRRFITILWITAAFSIMAEDLEQLRWDFQLEKIIEISESEDSSLQEKAEAQYYLYQLLSDLDYPLPVLLDSIEKAIGLNLELLDSNPEQEELIAIRLSDLYSGKIVDAASWMKYSSSSENWKSRARAINPQNKDLLNLDLVTLLYFPEGAGGNRIEGLALLEDLLAEYPEDPDFLIHRVDYALDEGQTEEAKEALLVLLNLYPRHKKADNLLKDIYLSEENLLIENIELQGEFRSRMEPVDKVLSRYIGKPYTMETKASLAQDLEELPAVNGVSIFAQEKNGAIMLTLEPSEEDTSIFGLLMSFGLSGQYNSVPKLKGIPAPLLLYNKQNLFGRGHRLMLICAWVFYRIDYTIPEQPGLPFDLDFSTSLMFLPTESNSYIEGKESDDTQEVNSYSLYGGVTKEFLGLTLKMGGSGRIDLFQKEKGDMVLSENNLTFNGLFELSMGGGDMFLSALPAEGLQFLGSAEIIYKPDYKSWGPEGMYTHNALPGGKYRMDAAYYAGLFDQHMIGAKASWFSSTNIYPSEIWTVGHGGMMSDGPTLNGYYPGEFELESGLTGEIGYYWKISGDQSLYVLHGALYGEEEWKQGSTLGLAFKMPGDIMMNLAGSMGWNAEREYGRGWQVDVTAVRLF